MQKLLKINFITEFNAMKMMKQNYAEESLHVLMMPGNVVPEFIHKENSTTFIYFL